MLLRNGEGRLLKDLLGVQRTEVAAEALLVEGLFGLLSPFEVLGRRRGSFADFDHISVFVVVGEQDFVDLAVVVVHSDALEVGELQGGLSGREHCFDVFGAGFGVFVLGVLLFALFSLLAVFLLLLFLFALGF